MVNDIDLEDNEPSIRVFVRAIEVFGRYESIADKYEEPDYPVTVSMVERGYSLIEKYLGENGTPIVAQQVLHLPFIQDGLVYGSNPKSVYRFNDCLVANVLSGNGFNVNHNLISAALSEEDILSTLNMLKAKGDYRCYDYWQVNSRFQGEVEVKNTDLSLLLGHETKS